MISAHGEPGEGPHADIELRDRLQAAGCEGPVWDYVAFELARYGWSVMSAWLKSRVIAGKCREKGRPVELPDDWGAEDREDLVATAVAHGLETFRQSMLADQWKPQKGASLRTYFLGGCVLAFPNALRRWRNERRRYHRAAAAWAQETAVRRPVIEPADMVDALEALESLTSEQVLELIAGYRAGETLAQLGNRFGIDRWTVSETLKRDGCRCADPRTDRRC